MHVQGVSIHPGQAKDKLVNALHLAAKIVDTLPHVTLTPETTAGREGFIHLYQMSGTAAAADLHFILRDFELRRPARARRAASSRSAPPCRPPSRARASPARSRRSTATCATGWRRTCARSSWRGRPAARSGIEPISSPDPRRHRRLAADRDGRADAESLHRHAEHPRPAGVGQRAGHGPRHRDVHRAGAAVEPRAASRSATKGTGRECGGLVGVSRW